MPGSFVDPFDVQDPETDDDILAAYGDALRQAIMFLRGKPRFVVRKTTVQSITDNEFRLVEFNQVDRDTHDGWDEASFKYVIPAGCGGDWRFEATINWEPNEFGTFRHAHIEVNSALIVDKNEQPQTDSGYATNNLSRFWPGAVPGDEFTVVVKHDRGSNLEVQPDGYAGLVFSGELIGEGSGE